MHIILTGATGLIGSATLQQMLLNESISRISILSRSPVRMAEGHEKAKVIIHNDFKQYDSALLEQLKDAHGCVWSLGVSQNAVGKTEYFDITHDYSMAAAKAFATLHPDSPFTFVYVSGEGATQTPGMFTPIFGRVKGQTETSLHDFSKTMPNFKVYNFRPGAVDWRSHSEIHTFIPSLPKYRSALLGPLNLLMSSMMTPSRPLGKMLMDLAMSQGEPLKGQDIGMDGRLVSNKAFRRMAGL